MGYYWLCGKRKRMSGCPVVFLLPRGPILWAIWSLILGRRRHCSWGRDTCLYPCPLHPDVTHEIELDDLPSAVTKGDDIQIEECDSV